MLKYIITGLPRSRTAWMSQYLLAGGSLCAHEHPTPAHVGLSDSGAVWHQDRLSEENPGVKWVVIRRSPQQVVKSMLACFPEANQDDVSRVIREHNEKLGELILNRNPLVVEYHELDDRAPEIATHCEPEWNHHELLHSSLCRLNIQLRPETQRREAVEAAKDLSDIEPVKISETAVLLAKQMKTICGANEAALRWWAQAVAASHVYDHLIDDDAKDSKETIHQVFEALLLEWPTNGFLREHFHVLVPAMSSILSAWRSNQPGRSGDVYSELGNAICFILNGQTGVNAMMPALRELTVKLMEEDMRKDGR